MPASLSAPLPPSRHPDGPYRVCCVCLGNICRSPIAEVVLRDQVAKAGLAGVVLVDSAGTGDWHVGAPMHAGSRKQLARNGYDGESHRARQIDPSWLQERDLVLAMDAANLRDLRAMAAPADLDRIRLFGEIAGLDGQDVPDPYYGTDADFARVLALLEKGMSRLAAQLSEQIQTPDTERGHLPRHRPVKDVKRRRPDAVPGHSARAVPGHPAAWSPILARCSTGP